MPVSMNGRQWCPACEVDYATHHRWLHLKSKSHKRNVDRVFPLPPSPWAPPKPQIKIAAEKFPHRSYRTTKRAP